MTFYERTKHKHQIWETKGIKLWPEYLRMIKNEALNLGKHETWHKHLRANCGA